MAQIEFYRGDADRHMAVLDDGAVPREGEFINIRGDTWIVTKVTWAIDSADAIPGAALRACVVLEPKGD